MTMHGALSVAETHRFCQAGQVGSDMVPFHKLSQWLSLSLLEPIEELGVQFQGTVPTAHNSARSVLTHSQTLT